jgi:hypothetical protein
MAHCVTLIQKPRRIAQDRFRGSHDRFSHGNQVASLRLSCAGAQGRAAGHRSHHLPGALPAHGLPYLAL